MALRRGAWVAAGIAGLLVAGAVTAGSAGAAPHPVVAPHWHVVESLPVKAGATGQFTAVVATGKTTGWAFNGLATPGGETAYERTGSVWKKMPFPGTSTEYIATAGATSTADVWAFADNISQTSSRALTLRGSKWVQVGAAFKGLIWGASVLGPKNVWVYGVLPGFNPAIGVWHYTGTWKQVGKNISGGSALSASDVWGFTATNVEHWKNGKWTATSVKSLLPPRDTHGLNDPQLVGIIAFSDKNVYAFGSADTQDEGGPVVVLHYNGVGWTKVAHGQYGYGPDYGQISSDGTGGLWFPMDGPFGGISDLIHYAGGKLSVAATPGKHALLTIMSVARIPGTTQQLAGGYTHPGNGDRTPKTAVILQYS